MSRPGEPVVELPLSTLLRHVWVTGTTGWGKSGFLLSLLLSLLTRHPRVGVVVLDAKGETVGDLRDRFVPALLASHPRLRPETVVTLEPFGPYGVPLNPLHPIPGLLPEVQAHLVCSLVDGLVDGGLGPRMTGMLAWLVRASMAVSGSLFDVLLCLRDERYRRALGSRVPDPEIREYLATTFEAEPPASREALRSRLEGLLLVPCVRGMLCARTSLTGSDLVEAPLTLIDLGGAPQGMAALPRFLGALLFQLLLSGCFVRPMGGGAHPVVLAVDEWQRLLHTDADSFEDLLSLVRTRNACLYLVNQTVAQVTAISPALARSLQTNVAVHAAFRPELDDLRHVLPLLPVTGRKVDPDYPDRLLTRDAERRGMLEQLAQLPLRHAALIDQVSRSVRPIRTLNVPYEQARQRAAALPQELRDRLRRGRFGVPMSDLIAAVRPALHVPEPVWAAAPGGPPRGAPLPMDGSTGAGSDAVVVPLSPRRGAPGHGSRRPRLVIP